MAPLYTYLFTENLNDQNFARAMPGDEVDYWKWSSWNVAGVL